MEYLIILVKNILPAQKNLPFLLGNHRFVELRHNAISVKLLVVKVEFI